MTRFVLHRPYESPLTRRQNKPSSSDDTVLALYDELFVEYGDVLTNISNDIQVSVDFMFVIIPLLTYYQTEERASAKVMSQKSEALLQQLKHLRSYAVFLR